VGGGNYFRNTRTKRECDFPETQIEKKGVDWSRKRKGTRKELERVSTIPKTQARPMPALAQQLTHSQLLKGLKCEPK